MAEASSTNSREVCAIEYTSAPSLGDEGQEQRLSYLPDNPAENLLSYLIAFQFRSPPSLLR
jgi:hypothetical protein